MKWIAVLQTSGQWSFVNPDQIVAVLPNTTTHTLSIYTTSPLLPTMTVYDDKGGAPYLVQGPEGPDLRGLE